MVKLWVLQVAGNRAGNFAFCCSTQSHFCTFLQQAQKEREELIEEAQGNYDPPTEERLKVDIYEITLKKVA